MTYERGNVIAVENNSLGSALAAATLAGATVLPLDDVADFPEDGGQVVIDSTIYLFDSVDLDADTLTLSTPLLTDAEEGEPALLWDPAVGDVSQETVAQIILEEGEAGEDPLEAVIPHALTAMLPEGIRDEPAESVALELDGQEWRVVDVLGVNPSIDGRAVWNPHSIRLMGGPATIPSSVWTPITGWANIESDGITLGSTLTIVTPALYVVSGQVAFNANATGRRYIRTLRNGDTVNPVLFGGATADDTGAATFVNATNVLRLAEGDVLSFEVFQNSGAGLGLSTGVSRCTASVYRISI